MPNIAELRELDDRELLLRQHDVVQELIGFEFQKATGQLENTAQVRALQKELARIKTVVREREIRDDAPKGSLTAKVGSLRDDTGGGYPKIRERFGKQA